MKEGEQGAVMTLRTPRRRISPRTKKRVLAIRKFFKRALGTTSEEEFQIGSSIALNVSDLKHTLSGIGKKLESVKQESRQFRNNTKHFESSTPRNLSIERTEANEHNRSDKSHQSKITILHNKPLNSDSLDTLFQDVESKREYQPVPTISTVKSERIRARSGRTKSDIMNTRNKNDHSHNGSRVQYQASARSTTSYHSSMGVDAYQPTYKVHQVRRREKSRNENYIPPQEVLAEEYRPTRRRHKSLSPNIRSDRPSKLRSTNEPNLDNDFITEIIRKQYKPIKMFRRRQSDLSQISAPVCRDQEYSLVENIEQSSDLCSCGTRPRRDLKRSQSYALYDTRTVPCEPDRYRCPRRRDRQKYHNQRIYNDSEMYDLIPVKEKSSPKSKKKFLQEYIVPYDYCKEVPPSPRTRRPRLNLKAQRLDDYEDYKINEPSRRHRVSTLPHSKHINDYEGETNSEIYRPRSKENMCETKITKLQNKNLNDIDVQPSCSKQLPAEAKIETGNDKTDKALTEIKDILQHFLQEIKKESLMSQTVKSEHDINKVKEPEVTNVTAANQNQCQFPNTSAMHSNVPPAYVSSYSSPCCYPFFPLCPINCMQGSYIMPTPSFTCASCLTNTYHNNTYRNDVPEASTNETRNETDVLIKEIYNYVANKSCANKSEERVLMTSRSADGTARRSKKDAQVNTPRMKCYSKSCEAIGSGMIKEPKISNTNASYSDTVIDRLSIDATHTLTDSESAEVIVAKSKKNRLSELLLKILKKKKKNMQYETTTSDSTTDTHRRPSPPPFPQEVTNYNMHHQEYFHRPPYHHHRETSGCQSRHCHCSPGYDDRKHNYVIPPHDSNVYNPHRVHDQTIYEHERPRPSAPPYPEGAISPQPSFNHMPQPPLCLKEIEVKSISTQSDRKMTFFDALKSKFQPGATISSLRAEDPQKNCSTQTAASKLMPPPRKPGLFNWKQPKTGFQTKSNFPPKPLSKTLDPMTYSYATQKQLAMGDMKMRNAMMKKLFYKRNPFSPRNLIVKTLLGKDRSSYGEPVAGSMFKPKLFM